MNRSNLLLTDGLINLALGVLLVAFPRALPETLGLPAVATGFYPSILGAVLFGIGTDQNRDSHGAGKRSPNRTATVMERAGWPADGRYSLDHRLLDRSLTLAVLITSGTDYHR